MLIIGIISNNFVASEANLLNFPSKNLKKLVPDHIINPSFKGFSEVSSSHDIESKKFP